MSNVEMLGQAPLASDRLARPLSPATRAGDFVFVSGQVPTDDQGQVIVGGIEAQTHQVFERIKQALALVDICTLADVAKVSVWSVTCGLRQLQPVCTWSALVITAPRALRWSCVFDD